MSDISAGRQRLLLLADELRAGLSPADAADEIEAIIEDTLYRASSVRRTPKVSRNMTPAIGRRVRILARATRMSNAEIAHRVGVNPGRVSEALNGQW